MRIDARIAPRGGGGLDGAAPPLCVFEREKIPNWSWDIWPDYMAGTGPARHIAAPTQGR